MQTAPRSTKTEGRTNDPTDSGLDPRTTRQLDELEAFINRQVTEVGHRWEAVADRTFETLFDGDVSAALAGRQLATAKYAALAARAGVSLQLDQPSLSRVVRVGAVNHRLARTDWESLPWSLKVELLPLLGQSQDFALLQKGVAVARKEGATVREVRQWVAARRADDGPDVVSPPKLTPLKAGKAIAFAGALRKVAARRELADKVRELDEEQRRAFLAALGEALRNLGKLQQELLTEDDAE
jgi:hypothetical protein